MKKQILILVILIVAFAVTNAAAQPYAITRSVIASGGGQNSTGTAAGGNVYRLDGTIGQTVAGQPATGAPFNVFAGFWNPGNFAPTAAGVTLGGRITTANGAGIRNVNVTLLSMNGARREVRSGAGGFYSFEDVTAGETFVISVAKRYRFAQPTQIHPVTEDVLDINFVAENYHYTPFPVILNNSGG